MSPTKKADAKKDDWDAARVGTHFVVKERIVAGLYEGAVVELASRLEDSDDVIVTVYEDQPNLIDGRIVRAPTPVNYRLSKKDFKGKTERKSK